MTPIQRESHYTEKVAAIVVGSIVACCGLTVFCIRKIGNIWQRFDRERTDLIRRNSTYNTFAPTYVQNFREDESTMPPPTIPTYNNPNAYLGKSEDSIY